MVAFAARTAYEVLILIVVVGERAKHGEYQHEEVDNNHCKRRQRLSNLPDVYIWCRHDQEPTFKTGLKVGLVRFRPLLYTHRVIINEDIRID